MSYNPNDKFNWNNKSGGPKRITSNDLVCKDCNFADKKEVLTCYKFIEQKPLNVLYGKECAEYEKRK